MGFGDGSGISWTMCKQSAPHSRQITTPPTLHHSIFTGRMLFLILNQRCQSTEGTPTHTHTFNGPLSGTTQVNRYPKGNTNLDFTEVRDSEWQWHQLGHKRVCTSLQTDNHANTSLLKFFTGRMPFLPPNQQCQSTECSKALKAGHCYFILCGNLL